MATLILSANPAEESNGMVSVTFMLFDEGKGFPKEQVEIRTAKDAEKALADYAEKIAAMGKGAACTARLGRGDRAPAGFRKMKTTLYVNL